MIKKIFYGFLILIFSSCSSAPAAKINSSSDSIIIPDDFFGMVHAGKRDDDNEYKLLDEMEIKWLLQTFYWSDIENERGIYDFSGYDKFVDTAKQRGKKVFATLAYSPKWMENEIGKSRYIPKEYIPDFLNFIEALVLHYKGKIDAFQIWNEPNFIFWHGKDKEFFNLSNLAAQRIRKTDPNAYIIGGGIFRVPKGFIKGMNNAGALENLDAFSYHPYALTPQGSIRLQDKLKKIITQIDFKGDILISEIGFPSGGWYPNKVSMKNYPSYVVKTITGSAVRGAKALFWYQLYDHYNFNEAPDKSNSENYFGLVYPDYSRKNASWAYELCARYLPGSSYNHDLQLNENIPSSIKIFYFTNDKNNTLILWNNLGKRKLKISFSSDFTIHNIATGDSADYSNEITVNITNEPLFITWQGSSIPRLSKLKQ